LIEENVKEKTKFERIVISKKEALELFQYNKFKIEILNEKVKDDENCIVYRLGDFIDPCKGKK
jgi:threonyl-tRNA synthetase